MVPVWHTNVAGDLFEGRFKVPKRLVKTAPHTNQRTEFEALVRDNIQRWADWRAAKGWIMSGVPKVSGPYDPPTSNTGDEAPDDYAVYMVHARFKREEPLFVPLENAIAAVDKAEQYNLDPLEDRLPWNQDTKEDSGIVNPLEFAEERRKRLGLKREDFLFGPLEEPL